MAKFQFRLATLLKLREAAREERRRQLAEAVQAEQVLHGRLRDADGQLHELRRRQVASTGPGRVQVDQVVQTQRYELVLQADRQVLASQHRLLAEEVERRRAALSVADREVRVLEKLRDRQMERQRSVLVRREIQEIDEYAGRPTVGEA